MKFRVFSIPGPKGENQDAIQPPFEVDGCTWCAIADGVGSAANGGLAARTAIDAVSKASGRETMREVFERARESLISLTTQERSAKSITTTLSILRICGDHAVVGHVGDTRISHYRGAGVMGRTKDQTEVQKLLDDGALTKHQAARYPRRNVLLSALSAGRNFDLHEQEFDILTADRVLLTSDGFHEKLLRGRIAEMSSANPNFDDFWAALVEAISSETLADDASCLALEF